MADKVQDFIDQIAQQKFATSIANPWSDAQYREDLGLDHDEHSAAKRRDHLKTYLTHRLETAKVILIAEAPGYQGCRFSGIPMTCERTILEHRSNVRASDVFGLNYQPNRTSHVHATNKKAVMEKGFSEQTAAYVWGYCSRHPGLSSKMVLWNLFGFHPHRPGEYLTNRAPKEGEILQNRSVLEAFLALFPDRPILSIGNISEAYLAQWGHGYHRFTRHPANGGGTIFRTNLDAFLKDVGVI